MTRKDYELIAEAIRDTVQEDCETRAEHAIATRVAKRLVSALRADNPRFDSVRFYEASGVQL